MTKKEATYSYLRPFQVRPLDWSQGSFDFPDMVRVGTYADGSCFFHSITLSYFAPYIRGKTDGKALDRIAFVKQLREELSLKLADKVEPDDDSSPSYYDIISRGELSSFGENVPNYSLKAMQSELASNQPVDNVYNEFISNILDKDIYLIDLLHQDVYVTGNDLDILFKGRDSIVILYIPGHYELVGLRNSRGECSTLFKPTHPFITAIQKRLVEKIQ